MFEKVKKAAKRIKGNVDNAKAKARGMSVAEMYDLDAKERRKKADYRKWELDEKYRLKKKAYTKSGGKKKSGLTSGLDALTGMGKNVLKNMGEGTGSSTSNFNTALIGVSSRSSRKKKGKHRKGKKKVVVYV
jgi:hypothetical protein